MGDGRSRVARILGWSAGLVLLLPLLVSCSSDDSESADDTASITPASEFYQGTRRERQMEMYECLVAAGYEMEIEEATGDGTGYGFRTQPDTDPEEFVDAAEACSAALLPAPFPQTDEEVREMYDHVVESYECLVAAGFTPDAPPSFQSFLDDYRASDVDYDPYAQGISYMDQAAAYEACPRDDDAWW